MGLIQTYTGKLVDVFNPTTDAVDILDIAWSLAHTCRFRGHCKRFYSVAEHCVRGLDYVPQAVALPWLLHDAAEAYLMDTPSPLKRHLWIMRNQDIDPWPIEDLERQWQEAIATRFGIRYDLTLATNLRDVDLRMLATERKHLMFDNGAQWENLKDVRPYETFISDIAGISFMPNRVAQVFLQKYAELTGDFEWEERWTKR